jgi:N-acetyltransferase
MAIATTASSSPEQSLISVDITPTTSLSIHPNPLPTPLGIPRLFVPSTHRRLGVATRLLSAAARTCVHGCALDPREGEVAFTQPTGDGAGVMRAWGGGGIRIYEE